MEEANRGDDWLIDCHHHIYPPEYLKANFDRISAETFPAKLYTNWSPEWTLQQMDAAKIRLSIVSISTPGVWWEGSDAGYWARHCNEYGARLIQDHPGRFGMFGIIPVVGIDESLREIEYALDTLKLDGIGVMTSYACKTLGDPSFAPVFDELNRRKAVVFVHPIMNCCGFTIPGVRFPTIEFLQDTARAIASLAYQGTFTRCPDIRFIFSHGGGTLPMMINRFANCVHNFEPGELEKLLPDGFDAVVRRQYYDIAGVSLNAGAMAATLHMVPPERLVYGSDVPFGSTVKIAERLAAFDLPPETIRAIRRGTAMSLFPRASALA